MKYKMPERYSHLVDETAYNLILKMALACLKPKVIIAEVTNDGIISIQIEEVIIRCALDNLVRCCAQEEREEDWFELVAAHFDKVFTVELKPDLSDFESAKALLSLRVYPNDYFDMLEDAKDNLIARTDFEEMITVLVLDLPDKFQSLTKDMIKDWNKTDAELFGIAQQNVNRQQIEVKTFVLGGKFELHTFFSTDYSVSYIVDIAHNARFLLGKYGAIVAMPSKGTVFAHAIDSGSVVQLIPELMPLVLKFYHEDPGNLTTNLYWYYKGVFHLFKQKIKEGGDLELTVPEKLYKLLRK